MQVLCVTDTNLLASKKPHGPNRKPKLSVLHYFARIMLNESPNASQWNMVMLGNITIRFALGMSISCCLFPFFAHVVTQHEHDFWWDMGFWHNMSKVSSLCPTRGSNADFRVRIGSARLLDPNMLVLVTRKSRIGGQCEAPTRGVCILEEYRPKTI